MRVLVTGGAGYVGSHAAKQLVQSGHDVLIVDNLAEGHRPAVGNVPFVSASLLDPQRLIAAMKEHKSEAVMHFAAFAYVGVSLREDHDPETHLIPLILQVALGQREFIEVFGTDYPTPDGTCIRDYIHVDDLATAHVAALEKLQPGMELKLNLGTGHGASVQEVVDLCREVTGRPIPARTVARREGDPPQLVANASAAKRELNWQARYTMREIIQSAWNWHREHPHGYGK